MKLLIEYDPDSRDLKVTPKHPRGIPRYSAFHVRASNETVGAKKSTTWKFDVDGEPFRIQVQHPA